MTETDTVTTIVVTLLVVLAPLAVLTVGFAGTAGAQPSGSVTITTDEIASGSFSFDVEITSLGGTQTGCLEVTNFGTEETVTINSVSEGERFTIFQEELGGFEAGDTVVATLYDDPSDCSFELDTDSRTVQESDDFRVSIDQPSYTVTEGDTVDVTATIENVGETQGTQTTELLIGNIEFGRTLEDDQQVTLDSGESQDVVLSWDTGQVDPGTYDATVTTEDDSDLAAINVQEAAPANFDVSIDSTNSPVVEGEPLGVTATVENTGDRLANQTITLRTGEQTLDSRPVALDGGQTATITLNWETEPGDAGEYSVNVASDDEIDFAEVAVLEAGNLDVSIDQTSSPVAEGEALSVAATVENTGNAEISGPVELRIGEQTVDSVDVTLPAGGSQSVTFEWATQPGDAGEHRATVASSSNTDSVIVTVQEPAELTFEGTSTNSPVVEGEELEVTTTVANTGEVSADRTVELRIDGEIVDSSDVSLIGGEDSAVTLVWQTEGGDAGEYVATVAGETVSNSAEVTVLRGAQFEVNITSTNSPVSGGESVEVTATVTNTGDVSGSQSVTLTADGVERDSRELTLESGESREITVSWATAEVEPGEYDVEVASQSDSETAVATLEESSDDSVPTTIWLLILLVLLILAAIYYYIRRRQLSERQSNAGAPPGAEESDESSGTNKP